MPKSSLNKNLASFVLLVLIFSIFGLRPLVGIANAQDEITCPSNSYLSGGQCLCSSGYVSVGGNCVTEAVACAPYGPSHLVGTDCVCNEGYGVLSGSSKCVSLSAACAQYNAIWNAAKGDCICASGNHEDASSGKCVADAPIPVKVEPTPTNTAPTPVPTPTPDQTVTEPINNTPAETTTSTTPTSTFQAVDALMAPTYATLPETVQTIIAENQTVITEMSTQTFSSQEDALTILTKEATEPLVNETILTSLAGAASGDVAEAKAQQAVLNNFSDQGSAEVQIKGEEIIPKLHEAFVREAFPAELKDWQQQYAEAQKDNKLKTGVDAKELANGVEMENRLKWQIAELQKIVGFNHLRCLEAKGALKFETMSKEYRSYFKSQSAENMFEGAAEGQAFSNAAQNASAGSTQLRELKDQLKKQYPADWQIKYYAVSAKPDLNKKLQQTDNIFKVFEKLKK